MLNGTRPRKFLAMLAAAVMTAGVFAAQPMMSVSATAAYYEENFADKTAGDEIKTGTNYSFTAVTDAQLEKTVGKLTALTSSSEEISIFGKSANKTGNVVLEQKIKFEMGDNAASATSSQQLKYRLKVNANNANSVEVVDIYPSKISSFSAQNDSELRLAGIGGFTPGVWYTIKVGIDTTNKVYHLYYQREGASGWITATPADGMGLRIMKSSKEVDYSTIKSVNSYLYIKNVQDSGIAIDYFKAYQVASIGPDMSETADGTPVTAKKGFSEDFENYAENDIYMVRDDMVWKSGKLSGADTELASSKIAVDPKNSANKVQKITYPTNFTAGTPTAIGYFDFDSIKGEMVYRNKFMFSANADYKSGSLQYHIGYRLPSSTSNEITDAKLMEISQGGVSMFVPNESNPTGSSSTKTQDTTPKVGISTNKWYEVAVVINSNSATYDCYLGEAGKTLTKLNSETLALPLRGATAVEAGALIMYPNIKSAANKALNTDGGYASNGVGYIGLAAMPNKNIVSTKDDQSVYLDDISLAPMSANALSVTEADGTATAAYQLTNDSGATKIYTLYMASYSADKTLKKISAKDITLAALDTVSDTSTVELAGGTLVRAFLWEKDTLCPVETAQWPNA